MASRTSLPGVTGTPAFLTKSKELQQAVFDAIPDAVRLTPAQLASLPDNVRTSTPVNYSTLKLTTPLKEIAKGTYSAVEVVTAFGYRAAIAHQLVHCLTELFLDEALETAKEQDEHFKRTGKTVGPLHGIPIGVKDHMRVKGHVGTAGFMSTLEISPVDGDQVAIFRAAGAIYHCKTNSPQSIMHGQSHSLFGRTLSPFHPKLVPSGSSGGTAALVALKGSCMAPGTDIGGSIRGPAGACGVYGMRPTSRTMPTAGHLWYQGGWEGIICSTGPICASARDADLYFRIVLAASPWVKDPFVIPSSWSPPDLKGKVLKIGYMIHDDVVRTHPPMERALKFALDKLKGNQSVKLVPYKAFEHAKGSDIAMGLYVPEGKRLARKLCSDGGEDMLALGEHSISGAGEEPLTAPEVFDLTARREAFRQAYQDHWNKQGIDVLLTPGNNATALPHDIGYYWTYTSIWNLVDYPGFTFPSGLFVDPQLDPPYSDFAPMSKVDTMNNSTYDAELMKGTSIALQLVARKYDDSLLMAAQGIVEAALKA